MVASDVCRRTVAVAFDEPVFVIGALEFQQSVAQVLNRFEPSNPEQIFLERAYEAFGASIAFWSSDEGR